jgi:uncharacterized membrane protein
MLFKILVILHTLGATVWTGGHLVLAATVLPSALKHRDPNRIHIKLGLYQVRLMT